MMVEMVVVFLGESVHKNYKIKKKNIWCNLKDTLGFKSIADFNEIGGGPSAS